MRRLTLGTLILLVGCSAPAPSAPASPTAQPTTRVGLAEAAAAAGVDADQLLDVGGTLVAPRLNGPVLELVRIGQGEDGAWQATVLVELPSLASFDDVVPDRTENFVTCPANSGGGAHRFVIGETTTYSEMRLEGLPSVGGHVTDGTYLIAITAAPPSDNWEVLGDGQRMSSGSATVFPAASQGDGCVAH